jgi:protein-tyrosine-phosphatase
MKKVLFVCTHNAGRSQMAEALFNRHAPDDVRAESAGQQPRREGVWPAVVEVMREIGIDLASKRPKRLMPDEQIRAAADGVLSEYAEVPVRSFVMPLAERKARELLAAEAGAAPA